MKPTEVARRLRLDDQTVFRFIRTGELQADWDGYRYDVSEHALDQFIESARIKPKLSPKPHELEWIFRWMGVPSTLSPNFPDWACDRCNYDRHICHFCGDTISHDEARQFGTCEGDREYGEQVLREAAAR